MGKPIFSCSNKPSRFKDLINPKPVSTKPYQNKIPHCDLKESKVLPGKRKVNRECVIPLTEQKDGNKTAEKGLKQRFLLSTSLINTCPHDYWNCLYGCE